MTGLIINFACNQRNKRGGKNKEGKKIPLYSEVEKNVTSKALTMTTAQPASENNLNKIQYGK